MTDGSRRKSSPLDVAKAVIWAFLGIRKRSALESDAAKLTLAQVIIAGIIGAALFVVTLLLIVRFVVGRAAL